MHKPKSTPAHAQTEEEWEEETLTDALGNALNPDGTLDFEKLHAKGHITTLDELESWLIHVSILPSATE